MSGFHHKMDGPSKQALPAFSRVTARDFNRMLLDGAVGCDPTTKKTGAKRRSPEEELHLLCFEWIFLNEPKHPVLKWTYHTPNGGRRSKAEAGRFKAMGVRAGVVDIINSFKGPSGASGFACELKAPGEVPTEKQKEFLAVASSDGFVTGVCDTFDQFLALMHQYLGVSRA